MCGNEQETCIPESCSKTVLLSVKAPVPPPLVLWMGLVGGAVRGLNRACRLQRSRRIGGEAGKTQIGLLGWPGRAQVRHSTDSRVTVVALTNPRGKPHFVKVCGTDHLLHTLDRACTSMPLT